MKLAEFVDLVLDRNVDYNPDAPEFQLELMVSVPNQVEVQNTLVPVKVARWDPTNNQVILELDEDHLRYPKQRSER